MNSSLFKLWELHGKDADGNLVFRQLNTVLHRRPQHSIEFKPSGDFIKSDVSSDGKISTRKGRFEVQNNSIIVRFVEDPYQDIIYNVKFNDGETLKVLPLE